MICVSKTEAKELRKLIPNIIIRRTVKQKSKRGHYYCVETPQVVAVIKELRGE